MTAAATVPQPGPRPQPAVARRPLVALIGNPNTGKTTLFNRLTGARAKVGNYPGRRVDEMSARRAVSPSAQAIAAPPSASGAMRSELGSEVAARVRSAGLAGSKRQSSTQRSWRTRIVEPSR